MHGEVDEYNDKARSRVNGSIEPARLEGPAEAVIELPTPDRTNDKPLAEALAERRSRRDFRPEPLSLTLLSNLLWLAFGINRQTVGYPGDAPSSVIEAPERNESVGKRVTGAIRAQSLLALCCAGLAAGCATAPFGASDANLELARNQAAYGSSVFELQCADCHGPRGEGRGGVPAILGEGALSRYPRTDSTYLSSYSGTDGQQPIRQAPAAELGRPEFVTAESLKTYLSHHMPKIKRGPLTDQDYWAALAAVVAPTANIRSPIGVS